jgi:hypothetical protein
MTTASVRLNSASLTTSARGAVERGRARQGLADDADAVGGVGDRGRKAQEDQDGQHEERSAAGDDVDRRRNRADGEQHQSNDRISPAGHAVAHGLTRRAGRWPRRNGRHR